jgi:hypothetical protein
LHFHHSLEVWALLLCGSAGGLRDAKLRMVVCAFYQRKLSELEINSFLLEIGWAAVEVDRDDTVWRVVLVYMLAKIHFDGSRLDEAYKQC